MAILCVVFTFCMIGNFWHYFLLKTATVSAFTFLFSIMDPVPWEVKLVFHIFGAITFVCGVTLTILTALANDCVSCSRRNNFYHFFTENQHNGAVLLFGDNSGYFHAISCIFCISAAVLDH